jgi:hypothetical protein
VIGLRVAIAVSVATPIVVRFEHTRSPKRCQGDLRLTIHSPIIGHFSEPEVEALVNESLWRPYIADCQRRAAVHPLVMALEDGRQHERDR